MDKVIRKIEASPFSGQDIMDITEKKTKILTYPQLYDFKNIDEVLHPYGCAVILYETKPSYGHWTCIIKHENAGKPYIEFYDPYGMAVDKQLNYISKEFRRQNNEEFPLLSMMMKKSPYPVKYNNIALQKSRDDVSTCGRHVAMRLILKHLKLGKYLELLTRQKLDPDLLVSYLTAFQR